MKAIPSLSVVPQAEWLQTWGIDELVSEGSRYWEQQKTSPDIFALKMRSRSNEFGTLNKMSKFGSFTAISMNAVTLSSR